MMLFSKQNYFPKRSSEKNDIVAFFHISLMSHRALQVTGLSHLLRSVCGDTSCWRKPTKRLQSRTLT